MAAAVTATQEVALLGRSDVMTVGDGNKVRVDVADNAGMAPTQPLNGLPALVLSCRVNGGTSFAGLTRKPGGRRGSVVRSGQRTLCPIPLSGLLTWL